MSTNWYYGDVLDFVREIYPFLEEIKFNFDGMTLDYE